MLESIADLLNTATSSSSSTSTLTTPAAAAQSAISQSYIALGSQACAIQSSYDSICSPIAAKATTSSSPLEFLNLGIDTAGAFTSAFVACACCSSTYYVPAIYDNAAWACDNYNTAASSAASTTSAAASNGEIMGLCYSAGGVNGYPSTNRLGATATTMSTAATSASESAAMGVAFLGAERVSWVVIGAAAVRQLL